MICRQEVPQEYMKEIREPTWQNQTIYGDTILEVNPKCEVVWEWHSHGNLDLNHYRILASPNWPPGPKNSTVLDWTHINTVRELPENKWYDAGDERFRPGNVMISPRQLDTVYIIDRETKDIVWDYSGEYFGGLSGQHEPYMIEKGLPGEGNVLIFDNGASPWKDLGHAGASYVLEVNPARKELEWVYDKWLKFHSTYTSSAQRLPNGNTLICEAAARRVFEVTPECETVWEYVGCGPRSYRYAYDYCPQTAALGLPNEVSVTPPAELRIPPDAPLAGVLGLLNIAKGQDLAIRALAEPVMDHIYHAEVVEISEGAMTLPNGTVLRPQRSCLRECPPAAKACSTTALLPIR